ncbi:hypothetical protein MNEG_4074, partial [Monoraphidium neglectum]
MQTTVSAHPAVAASHVATARRTAAVTATGAQRRGALVVPSVASVATPTPEVADQAA